MVSILFKKAFRNEVVDIKYLYNSTVSSQNETL